MQRSSAASAQGDKPAGARIFFAAALPALALYSATLAPTVSSEDSGELITAAYTLGIAHPPGYPLWCLLGKLFTFLPFGSVAWRVNFLSAVLGAAAVGVLALLAYRFTRRAALSELTALLFAASRDFWSQAVVAEVYTLNVLLFLLLLEFVLCFEDTFRTRWLYLAAFTLALGLTNHTTLLPLGPVFFGWVFLRHRVLFRKPLLLANLSGAFLLGFSLILYLPMRSSTDPYVDWGHPESFSELLTHFFRRQYVEKPRPMTLSGQAVIVWKFLETFSEQFTPAVAALVPLGALSAWRRDRSASALLAVLFALTSYGFLWLLNYTPDRQSLHLTRVFFLPAHAVGALWISAALRELTEILGARYPSFPLRRTAFLRLAGGSLLLLPLLAHFRSNDQTHQYLAEDWGRNILGSLKPDSVLVPSADHSTFPLLYLQATEGLRTDVLVANKYGYIDEATLRELLRGKTPPRLPPPTSGSTAEKECYLVEHSARPVYFTTKTRLEGLPGWELSPWGLVFEAVAKGTKPDEKAHEALWRSFRFRQGSLTQAPGDFSYDLILSDYHYARARWALLFSRLAEACSELELAARHGFGIKEVLNNLGGTLAEAGKPELALPYLHRALEVDPDYDLATKNIASAHFQLKRYREGLPWFERTLELEPGNLLARLGKARAHKELGQGFAAYSAYMQLYELDPWNGSLRGEIEEHAKALFGPDSSLARLPPARNRPGELESPGADGGLGALEPPSPEAPHAFAQDPLEREIPASFEKGEGFPGEGVFPGRPPSP